MVDRPFLRGARFTEGSSVINPAVPDFSTLTQLVRVGDIPSEDAALVEDIWCVSNEAYPDDAGMYTAEFGLYVYAPNQSAPATSFPMMIGKYEIGLSGGKDGLPQPVILPSTNAPTPQTGNTNLLRPIMIGKMEGLYLEKGYILCVGYLGAGGSPTTFTPSGSLSASGVTWFAQGGFY
tara:strand:+ start:452 stop:985 length:534 start_codon:yes stop_codon:yes gene_type:complete